MKVQHLLVSLQSVSPPVIATVLCLLIMLPASPIQSASSSDRESQKAKIDQGIKKYEINIRRLQKGIEKQQQKMQHAEAEERGLLADVQEIDTRLYEHKQKLRKLEKLIGTQQLLINQTHTKVNHVQQEKQKVQDHLQKRIQAYYKMGKIGFINVTFSTKSLPELLDFHESFQSLIKYDQSVIKDYRHSIEKLERSIETFEIEKALLEDLIERTKEEQEQIASTKEEKEELLFRIRTQKQLHEKAVAELEEATRSLTASLKKLEKKDKLLDQTFLNSKGNLPPPVTGELVAEFQQEVTNRLGIKTISQGIAVTAPNGTMVKAVHEGTISFSGYLRGYGNTVIVNHGYQYYSVSSRLEQILVKKGMKVETGAEIGIMGDTATLMSEGLYFEIRNDATPLDPLAWLDTSKLKKAGKKKQ